MNEDVLQQLGSLADVNIKSQAERIIIAAQDFSVTEFLNIEHSDKRAANRESYRLQLQLLISKYMGVF
jgi:hypothetical protein